MVASGAGLKVSLLSLFFFWTSKMGAARFETDPAVLMAVES